MKDEIFSVKLSQLDDRIGKLHSRIHMSEAASHNQLQREIHDLTRECIQEEWKLREHMRRSKSGLVSVLSGCYGQVEQIIQNAKEQINAMTLERSDPEAAVEEKILLAEYALDFAYQAADRALLLSMNAIDAQRKQQEEGRRL